MTPQESQSLQQLLSQLVQVKEVMKDVDAERMISRAAAQQPNAVYLLVQRAMILEQALNAAQERIAALEAEHRSVQSSSGNSFLDANVWGKNPAVANRSLPPQEVSVTGAPLREPASRPFATQTAQASPAASGPSSFLRGGSGSMLGTIAATAAGVAGGAFLFQGIGNLLGNHPHHLAGSTLGNQDNFAGLSTDNRDNTDKLASSGGADAGSSEPVFDDPGGLDIPTDEQLANDADFDTGMGSDSDNFDV